MNLKQSYYFLFYKIYKFSEATPSKSLSDLKAGCSIVFLEVATLISIYIYYIIFFDRYQKLEFMSYKTMVPLGIIVLFNYFTFSYNDRWKIYVEEFDKLPAKINQSGTIWVVLIIFFLLSNLFFSFYLMSEIDWKPYR